jgi:hypothetical protein
MPDSAEHLRLTEYRELRATIRERGSIRVIASVITFSVWAASILTVGAWIQQPIFALVPLVVLAAGFEIAFAIHTGVERVGRYLQVHHEPRSHGSAAWEQTAMRFTPSGRGTHPLLPALHIAAAVLNLTLAAMVSGDLEFPEDFRSQPDILIYAALHLAFIARVMMAARAAATQRAADLEQMRALLSPKDPLDPNS